MQIAQLSLLPIAVRFPGERSVSTAATGMGEMFVPRDSDPRLRPHAELKKAQTVAVLLGITLLLIVVAAALLRDHRRLVDASGSQPPVGRETR
jgi:hypothetical protein